MTEKHMEIVHCLRCGRIKAWDEDCSYLGCNPELHWQEATAVEVYSALHPEGVERERLRGELAALREAAREVIRTHSPNWSIGTPEKPEAYRSIDRLAAALAAASCP
jgi:hypothetical protein